jgi:hypothetical protein
MCWGRACVFVSCSLTCTSRVVKGRLGGGRGSSIVATIPQYRGKGGFRVRLLYDDGQLEAAAALERQNSRPGRGSISFRARQTPFHCLFVAESYYVSLA